MGEQMKDNSPAASNVKPTEAQLGFLAGLIRAGGTYTRFAGVRPAGAATVRRCTANGWIEPVGGRADRSFEYAITQAGRLAVGAAAHAEALAEDAERDAAYRASIDADYRASGALDDTHAEALAMNADVLPGAPPCDRRYLRECGFDGHARACRRGIWIRGGVIRVDIDRDHAEALAEDAERASVDRESAPAGDINARHDRYLQSAHDDEDRERESAASYVVEALRIVRERVAAINGGYVGPEANYRTRVLGIIDDVARDQPPTPGDPFTSTAGAEPVTLDLGDRIAERVSREIGDALTRAYAEETSPAPGECEAAGTGHVGPVQRYVVLAERVSLSNRHPGAAVFLCRGHAALQLTLDNVREPRAGELR